MTQGASHSAAGVREGDILAGKYRVERVLGLGGMGVVVAAHHIQLDEKVALKFLLPEALGNPEALARFVREARAAVKIKSEHVARVSDVGTLPNGAPYMVMEYLNGGDLADWLKKKGALPIEQAIEFVLQACVAVADAHALGIGHRDLKPANLFYVRRSDGQLSIKVLDFGISKMADTSGLAPGSMTRTSALMGSPLYMSPEQMRSSKDVDAQTDIWALGIILFELMTGRSAFLAESVTELAIKVTSEPTAAIRGLRPEVPSELEEVIFKCLEKDRRQRYRNVAELAVALLPFAPKRARASVDRISGIVQAAGLSVSALAVPESPRMDAGQVSGATLPAMGRTTVGGPEGKRFLGAGVASALVLLLAVVGTVILFKRASTPREAPQAAEAIPSPGSVASVAVPQASQPPPPVAVPTVDPRPLIPSPTATQAQPVIPPEPGSAPRKKSPAKSTPAPAAATPGATPITAAAVAPSPTAAKCDPPFTFDARGNRVFKPECL